MSNLVDDKTVIDKRRRKKLQEVDADLKDQVVQKLYSTLEDSNFPLRAVDIWYKQSGGRNDWMLRQEVFLANWDNFSPNDSSGAFEESSNLHLPTAFTAVKTLHARMYQAIVGVDPPFSVKSRREDSIERAQMVEDLMSYALKEWVNRNQGIEEVLDTWIWDWVSTGVGILKASWEKQFEQFVDVELGPVQGPPQFGINDQGEEFSTPTIDIKEKEILRTIEKFVGPRVEHVRPEDLALIGGMGNPDNADMVIHRQFLTASDLWSLADQKVFKEEVVKEVIRGGEQSVSGALDTNIKQQRALQAGRSELDTESDLDRYEILECYASVDVMGSGINSQIIAWVHTKTKKMLRATYLHRVMRSGERPFVKIDFHKRPDQDYGMGLVEILHPLSVEIDAMHNMRVDFGMISNMPYGFYRPSSNINPETIELKPGALIPLDNPQQDVYFPSFSNRTAFGFQEESSLQTMVQRLTGISDLTLGVMSGSQGATRTATGARALIGEANANLDIHLRRLNQGWKKCLELIFHMMQQRIPRGKTYRVTGTDGQDYFGRVRNAEDISGDFDFELSANTDSSNQAVKQQKADIVLQLALNPLALQLGIVSQGNIFEAYKNKLQSIGVKDWSRFISKPQGVTYMLAPMEELNRVLMGMNVPMSPQMDHEGYLALWEEFKKSDEFGAISQEQARMGEAQAQQHAQMLQALQQQEAQAANVQQQQLNAQQSFGQESAVGTGVAGDQQ